MEKIYKMLAYVIGSGPGGVSVSKALLSSGHKVVMLDYANKLKHDTKNVIEELAKTPINKWNNKLLSKIIKPLNKKVPDKLAYGDDFPYRESLSLLDISLSNCGLSPSLAQGGLSNVWGASILPYIDKDIADWPITISDLAPHYEAVANFMPIAATVDDLSNDYPIYGNYSSNKISTQIQGFHKQLIKHKQYCLQHNIQFGYSRNAVHINECQECGLCMRGCPFELIYNSCDTLNTLINNKNFTYISDVLINKFTELNNKVQIAGNYRTGDKCLFIADKLFLAGGVLSTAKVVLASLKTYNKLTIKESPYFISALFLKKSAKKTTNSVFALSQMFLEINDNEISNNTIHLQVYPSSEILLAKAKSKLKLLYNIFAPIIKLILSRTLVIQGFLHSNEGKEIEVIYSNDILYITGHDNMIRPKIDNILRKLRPFGVPYGTQESESGRSFHCGGSFPMVKDSAKSNKEAVVDVNGCLKGTNNIHIVDASILPSIPSQTITYTVMANAHRIGSSFRK